MNNLFCCITWHGSTWLGSSLHVFKAFKGSRYYPNVSCNPITISNAVNILPWTIPGTAYQILNHIKLKTTRFFFTPVLLFRNLHRSNSAGGKMKTSSACLPHSPTPSLSLTFFFFWSFGGWSERRSLWSSTFWALTAASLFSLLHITALGRDKINIQGMYNVET